MPASSVYRIYVSAITQLNLDRHNRVSISDTRLLRRIVRDAATRGYSAAETLRRWDSVQRGERLHIFPFTENSDAIFNSSLAHELSVLRPLAEPLLLQVRPDSAVYGEANRLLSFLQWFRPVPTDVVPDNSILREFVGGSILENFPAQTGLGRSLRAEGYARGGRASRRGPLRAGRGDFEAHGLADHLLERLDVPAGGPQLELGVAVRAQLHQVVIAAIGQAHRIEHLHVAAIETLREPHD